MFSPKLSSSPHGIPPVAGECRIFFDETCRTFRLYPGESLYAFSITQELSLEHLYFGPALHPGFDLRYLSSSSRRTHFETSEMYEKTIHAQSMKRSNQMIESDEILFQMAPATVEDLQEIWRRNRVTSGTSPLSATMDTLESFERRRRDNFAWRMMSLRSKQQNKLKTNFAPSPISTTKSSPLGPPASSPTFTTPLEQHHEHQQRVKLPPYNREGISSLDSVITTPPITSQKENEPPSPPPPLHRSVSSASFIGKPAPIDIPSFFALTESPQGSPRPTLPESSFERLKSSDFAKGSRKVIFDRRGGKIGKGSICSEYSDLGTGDFRSPSFVVVDTYNGSSISPLRYRRHEIMKGKLNPKGLPCFRRRSAGSDDSEDGNDCMTLVVTMGDLGSGLEVDLIYSVFNDYDAVIRRTVFRNLDYREEPTTGKARAGKIIQRAMSITNDFEGESNSFYCVKLCGSWGRERHVVSNQLTHGITSFSSTRGVSGHQHSPFVALTIGPPSETSGEVKAWNLVYSGNYMTELQLNDLGRLRVNVGINPECWQWYLKDKEFTTPECVLVRSSEGLGGMSRCMHRLIRDKLMPRCKWAIENPPILINTWEAYYFDIDYEKVMRLARHARKIGVDLLVLDDGWFLGRTDDRRSLGNWVADPTKFPSLCKLSQDLKAIGMRLGLWFEPEMASEDSILLKEHPDYYFHVPNRPLQVSRHQFALDLSRKEVVDYLFKAISEVLRSADISYIKWDINRPLTEVFSLRKSIHESCSVCGDDDDDISPSSSTSYMSCIPPVWQAETAHRYMKGVYDLQHRLTQAFPDIMLETSASGGGRFDCGMLYYSHQIWASDNTDAIARMRIQYGTSLAFPTCSVGAHVSEVPNHITGNSTRARTRGFVSMCGTFGFELDIANTNEEDLCVYAELCKLYKELSPIILNGDLYRLWSPFESNFAAWMYVTRDKRAAIVFAFSAGSDHWSNLVPRLHLQGLDADAEYELSEPLPNNVRQSEAGNLRIETVSEPLYMLGYPCVRMTGKILMCAGLPLRFYTLDDSLMFVLNKVETSTPSSLNTSMDGTQFKCPSIIASATGTPGASPKSGYRSYPQSATYF